VPRAHCWKKRGMSMSSIRISANLGFLWADRPLPLAIRAAAEAGFDAVELHWPYDVSAADVRASLVQTGLPVVSLNTVRGNPDAGEFGLAALPGRESDARAAIEQAVAYAREINCPNVHVMAGIAGGEEARHTYVANLRHAADVAARHGIGILIEPINTGDVPGYFLSRVDEAASLIGDTRRDGIRIMFDCYHIAHMGEDILAGFARHAAIIGHVQFAAVPDRREPDHGVIDYAALLPRIARAGYAGYFGAEYWPRGTTDEGLSWLAAFGARRPA
jgi:2-dehydrotetronate isomerase